MQKCKIVISPNDKIPAIDTPLCIALLKLTFYMKIKIFKNEKNPKNEN